MLFNLVRERYAMLPFRDVVFANAFTAVSQNWAVKEVSGYEVFYLCVYLQTQGTIVSLFDNHKPAYLIVDLFAFKYALRNSSEGCDILVVHIPGIFGPQHPNDLQLGVN
jgi:hypothetical protein